MKQIRNLTADWIDLDTQIKNIQIEMRRAKALERYLIMNTPSYLNGKYFFSSIGERCIRCFIDLDKSETNTVNLLKWLPELKKNKWSIRKFWRIDSGYFAYWAKREIKGTDYIILFEKTANIDGCVIEEKEVTQKIYVTNCEKEEVML